MKPKYWNKGRLYLSKKDKVLKLIIENNGKEYLTLNKNYFHCLINSIIGQQISVSAANSIKNKFFSLNKNINPKIVKGINNNTLKKIGLSKQKILYIKNIANFFLKNKQFIYEMNKYSDIEIRKKLIDIKGVGPWTIDMFLIFSLGKSNIFPKGDLGFLKAIKKHYKKENITDKYLEKLYKRWTPYGSVATWYLWKSLDPIPINY